MLEDLSAFFDSSHFMPHGHCYLWRNDVLWLNVGSDLIIALSYFSIPVFLVVFLIRRKDLVFNWVFAMFAAFIFACGATHLLEIWTVWHPDYVLQGLLKLVTAIISFATAVVLWPLMPKALRLPSPSALEVSNKRLEAEIAEKTRIQNELVDAKRNLELRVEQRTADLRIANKMKDEFLTTLSHELRTPLNVMMGYADLLMLEEPNSEQFNQAVDAIQRNAYVQGALIDDLLDVSRIITGKIQLESHLIDPISIIRFSIDATMLSANAKEITVKTQFDDETGFIVGDSTRLQQVFWNLIANAVKFSNKGNQILISTRRHESKLEVSVKDWGSGIDAEFLPYVFDRFRQEDSSTTRTFGGLGLGLAIVRHIVELHGGTVDAASKGKGQGATFVVQLPITTPSSKPSSQSQAQGSMSPHTRQEDALVESDALGNVKILVLDDENDTRIVIKAILERFGATVKVAASADDARNTLKIWLPDIIISDIGMRNEDGYTFIRSIRLAKERRESEIPAIALTAYAREEDRNAALEAGFQAHASKPIGAPQLVEIILRLLPTANA